MEAGRLKRFIEFLVVGVVFGVIEDVLAVVLTTDASISYEMIGIVLLVAVPFAALSELIVDHPDFVHFDRVALWLKTRGDGTTGAGDRRS